MPSKKVINHIALELCSLEKKVAEFREYLDNTQIKSIVDDDKRHGEIKIQLLLVEKLGPIVAQLEELKRKATEDSLLPQKEIRGDTQLSPLEEGLI